MLIVIFYKKSGAAILDSKNDMKFILGIPKTPYTIPIVSFYENGAATILNCTNYLLFVAYQITTKYLIQTNPPAIFYKGVFLF